MLAVGTTTVRVLETLARGAPLAGRTDLFVTPGFEFRRVDALLTNFHLPRSTLLALVMAFAGIEETRDLYELAIAERYRFYSFGDAMLIRLSMAFTVTATDGEARRASCRTRTVTCPRPRSCPWARRDGQERRPDELRELGARSSSATPTTCTSGPGDELVAELGGLHAFMGWDGPILTDSGGFQVFSLRDTLLAVDDDGVTFRSVYDGAPARFTPETVAEIQATLGSDVAMCLDICQPAGVPRTELAEAVRRTTLWAIRQAAAPRAPGQLVFGITQGGSDPELRRRSIAEITDLGFDGHALGGLSVGEPRGTMFGRRRLGGARAAAPTGRATSWASATPRACSR